MIILCCYFYDIYIVGKLDFQSLIPANNETNYIVFRTIYLKLNREESFHNICDTLEKVYVPVNTLVVKLRLYY